MDEYPVQSLGFINRLKNRLSQVNQRTALDAFIVILILVGLAASVYLAGQRQIFRSRAAQNGSAEVVDEQGNAIPKEGENFIVETQQIRLKIIPPTTWNQTQGSVFQLVNNRAYAQQGSCGSAWTDGRTTACYDTSSTPASNCDYLWAWSRDDSNPNKESSTCGTDAPYCWACPAQQSAPIPTPERTLAPAVTKGITCESINGQCGDSEWKLRGSGATCSGINRSYKGYNNDVDYTDCDTPQGQYPYCYTGCETAGGAALTTGSCRPLRPNEVISEPPSADQKTLDPSSYLWKEDCNKSCSDKSECPRNTADPYNVTPETSNWCYGFEEGKRCLQLQYIGGRGGVQEPTPTTTLEEETTAKVRISLNQDSVKKDGSCTESNDLTQTCKEVSVLDLDSKGNIIDWPLPPTPNTYTIYIGFISNKGGYKDATVTVAYKPKGGTISGKLKIIANGQKYKEVWIDAFSITNENPVTLGQGRKFIFPSPLPSDQDQETNFSFSNLPDPKYALVSNLITENGKHISGLSKIDCPNSPISNLPTSAGCLINTGATDANLTLEIPPAGQATASPTPTTTPASKLLEKDIVLTAIVKLQGIGVNREQADRNNSSPRRIERDIRIIIFRNDNNISLLFQNPDGISQRASGKMVYRPNKGDFTANFYPLTKDKPLGERFTIGIWVNGYLYNQRSHLTLDSREQQWFDPVTPLLAGDVNGDNVIDAKDLKIVEEDCLGAKWQTASCAYKDTADANDDGKVDGVDANYVRVNLGKKGD